MFQNQYINPIFDDDYSMYSPFSRRQYYNQQRRAEEEARRRAALEYHYQQQQQQAILRRRLQEEAYRQRLLQLQQHEERRRRQQEEEYCRQRLAEASQMSSDSDEKDSHGADGPHYALVRGRDGTVYKLRLPDTTCTSPNDKSTFKYNYDEDESEDDHMSKVQNMRMKGHSYQAPIATSESSTQVENKMTVEPPKMFIRDDTILDKRNSKKDLRKKEEARARNDVLVEDASLSEYEDDDYKSIWRNRRPAPGETWMEPIPVAM